MQRGPTRGWKADWLIDPARTIQTALLSCCRSEAEEETIK